ncbi:D-glycero-alpha-D-manno-heptose-1,7-bisphosphate 7-phosphatase [Planctomycetes bacterium Pla163]|uniref:D-glycero-alpha-D-manno-heptose-1,7-bisphosphate 7-phosphatase n=1 Tax=Rohdeia mirabilis TaxID=2528008 RepID=A0A518D134_9BACT|nr:D-glycero-alpha-D-manno-heptose-1,7-bisphosphate 7-phosphatase [Planctomycetes bacterium Pla163]
MDHERPAGIPIPGTTPTPRGLFLDVWGTLCELPPGGRASAPADVRFVPGVLDALFACHREGWRLYLVGNETDVALGHLDERTWKRVEETLMGGLEDAGIEITRSYICTTHPNGIGHLQSDSVYMLPGTGGFYHASHNDGIDIERSWVVGDSTLELVAGWRAGLMTCAVATGRAMSDGEFHVDVDVRYPDLTEFLGLLLQRSYDRAG